MSLERLGANDEQKSLEQFIEDVPKDVLHKLIVGLLEYCFQIYLFNRKHIF